MALFMRALWVERGGKLVGGDRVICRKREGEWREFYATWTWKLFTHGCTAKRRKNKGEPLEGGIPKKWQLFNTRPRHLFAFFFAIPTLLILPLFFLQSVRSFFITLSAEVQIGWTEEIWWGKYGGVGAGGFWSMSRTQVAPLRAI